MTGSYSSPLSSGNRHGSIRVPSLLLLICHYVPAFFKGTGKLIRPDITTPRGSIQATEPGFSLKIQEENTMKRLTIVLCTLVLLAFSAPLASATTIALYDYASNVDGAFDAAPSTYPAPPGSMNPSGLGTWTFTIVGAGDHSIDVFLDYEIDEADNTFFNEYGAANGAPAPGQSWEIDEPGFVFGDIYDNTMDSLLDNTNAIPDGENDDVSMALGWDFSLPAGNKATIDFIVSNLMPKVPFYLSQTDPDSDASIYFYSSLNIRPIDGGQVPEPGTWILMLTGLAITGGIAAKRNRKRS